MSLPETGIEPLDNYCESVMTGKTPVGNYAKKAVQRHYDDLERWGVNHYSQEEGKFEREPKGKYYFDPNAARYYASFFEQNLEHYDGIFAGNPFTFEPWQWFAKASPFGWLKYERINDMAVRRFSSMDIFIPKKQGKSAWIGGNMLYFLEWDNYPGAQIYSLAINQSHAKELGYRDAEIMAENSPTLRDKYKVKKGAAFMGIYYPENNSHIKPLVSNEEIADGPKIHLAANDEIKDWKNKELYETLVNGTASDPMAMVVNISTAGTDKQSLGYDRYEYITKLLDGAIEDESSFGIIYGIDDEDKEDENWWQDIDLYKKANPNFGVTVGEDYYKERINSAIGSPSKIASLKCKHLNEWVNSLGGFITYDKWDKCNKGKLSLDDFKDRRCHSGLDLGEISDFSAFALLGEPRGGNDDWIVKMWYWIPSLGVRDRKNFDIIRPWIDDGWIKTTPGNATDYQAIRKGIESILEYGIDIDKFFYDNSKSENMPTKIMAEWGLGGGAVPQRASKMNAPIEEIQKLVFDANINFGNDPVLAWMNSNVIIKKNYNDEKRFDKGAGSDKMDGMVALAMSFIDVVAEQEKKQQQWGGDFVAA